MSMQRPIRASGLLLSFGLLACIPAQAQDGTIEGTIRSYECGDNCYLTITDAAGEEQTGLCAAPECADWNEAAAMPSEFEGRQVVVTLGEGVQTDAEGNVMGGMTAFTKLDLVD